MLHPVRRRAVGGYGTPRALDSPTRKTKEKDTLVQRQQGDKSRRRLHCPLALKRVIASTVGILLLFYVLLYPILVTLVGNGYSSEGGVLGRGVDRWLHARYTVLGEQAREIRHESLGLRLPLVLLRSNRKEVSGYSRFLEEILSLREEDRVNYSRTSTNSTADSQVLLRGRERLYWENVRILESASISQRGSEALGKDFLMDRLQSATCRPGWLCHRCLNSASYGSVSACESVCPPCYERIMCNESKNQSDPPKVPVTVTKSYPVGKESLIPRVIHQFWTEPVTTLDHPELVRMQNSWRSSGFRYQFYAPVSARAYIQANYPARFLQSFDSIQSFDIQSNLFRLLVLFKEGGIYANIDLMLETNLDALLTPSLSFFAARDDSTLDHCLWNGLVGSQAGNAVIGRAIETFVNAISNHGAGGLLLLVLEQDVCRATGREANVWKIRVHPEESLFGSCALGMAAHEELSGRNDALESFPLGVYPSLSDKEVSRGETLILLMSQEDTGAFRCSDVHRNVLVASTGMTGLTKESVYSRITNPSSLRSSREKLFGQLDLYTKKSRSSSRESIQLVYETE